MDEVGVDEVGLDMAAADDALTREDRRYAAELRAERAAREKAQALARIDRLPFTLREASRSVDELLVRLLERHDRPHLSLNAVHALVLARHPMPVVSMARRLRISPQATGRAIGELERQGLVEKRPSPRDARALLVGRTGDGEDLMHEIREDLVVTVCIMADALSEDRLGELADELAELAHVDVDAPRW